MENLQAALNALKDQDVYFKLVEDMKLEGKIVNAGLDFVYVAIVDELIYVPYNSIVYFRQPGTVKPGTVGIG
jgi:hypothetical protein